MNVKVIISAVAMTIVAAPSFAQTTDAAVATTTTTTGTAVVAPAAGVTGFVPIAGAALGAAGPLAIGLGAIIAIGAISGGGSSSGTNGTN